MLLASLAVVSFLLGEAGYQVLSRGFGMLPTFGYNPVGNDVIPVLVIAGVMALVLLRSYPAWPGYASRIVVNDGYLRWYSLRTTHDTPWSDITGLWIVTRGEGPISVKLKTSDRQTIRLTDFEDMTAITSLLRERLPEDVPVKTKRARIPIDKPAFVGALNLLVPGLLLMAVRTCISLLSPYVMKTPRAATVAFACLFLTYAVCMSIARLVRPGMAFDAWSRMRDLVPGLPERNYLAWVEIVLGGMVLLYLMSWLLTP